MNKKPTVKRAGTNYKEQHTAPPVRQGLYQCMHSADDHVNGQHRGLRHRWLEKHQHFRKGHRCRHVFRQPANHSIRENDYDLRLKDCTER